MVSPNYSKSENQKQEKTMLKIKNFIVTSPMLSLCLAMAIGAALYYTATKFIFKPKSPFRK